MEDKIYASELSGHCNELTAWQILAEISEALIHKGLRSIDPQYIEIGEDGHFSLAAATVSPNGDGFDAPETTGGLSTESGAVWSLGAILFFIVMGRQVMNGKGGKGQRDSSKLPYMRSEWPEMSELVQNCLQFNPARRPTLQQVYDRASQQYQRCLDEVRKGPKLKIGENSTQKEVAMVDQDIAFWPETMQVSQSNL